jgi:hypothetical protein
MSFQSVPVEQHLRTLMALSNVSGRSNTNQTMQQEVWRYRMQTDVLAQARSIKGIVADLRATTDRVAKKEDKCLRCGVRKYPQDMVRFECPPPKGGRRRADPDEERGPIKHDFCMSCVYSLVKEQGRLQTSELGCRDSQNMHRHLQARRPQLHLLVCPACHVPCVVEQSVKFNESLERDVGESGQALESQTQYAVHLAATRLLRDNYYTDEVQENQRRSFFGAFSGNNLLVWDLCGEFSDPRAQFSEIETEDFHARFQRPNGSWIWLEPWTPREWVYGDQKFEPLHDVVASGKIPAERLNVSGVSCLVRTRRKMRTRIRMNEDVRDGLLDSTGQSM